MDLFICGHRAGLNGRAGAGPAAPSPLSAHLTLPFHAKRAGTTSRLRRHRDGSMSRGDSSSMNRSRPGTARWRRTAPAPCASEQGQCAVPTSAEACASSSVQVPEPGQAPTSCRLTRCRRDASTRHARRRSRSHRRTRRWHRPSARRRLVRPSPRGRLSWCGQSPWHPRPRDRSRLLDQMRPRPCHPCRSIVRRLDSGLASSPARGREKRSSRVGSSSQPHTMKGVRHPPRGFEHACGKLVRLEWIRSTIP